MASAEGSVACGSPASRLDDLYSFLTTEAGPVTYVSNYTQDSILLSKLLTDNVIQEDKYVRADSELGNLVILFEKYLRLRLSPTDFPDEGSIGLLKYLVESMFTVYADVSGTPFTLNALWLIEAIAHKIRCDRFLVSQNAKSVYGRSYTLTVFNSGVQKYLAYFGEFLYFCSTVETPGASSTPIISQLKEAATPLEIRLIDELSRIVVPELGITTFIVYRNWASDVYPLLKDTIAEYWKDFEAAQSFETYHTEYCEALEKVKQSDVLSAYFKKMVKFLSTTASTAHRAFNSNVLISGEFLENFLSNKDYALKLMDHSRYLVRLCKFMLDAVLFLDNGTTLNYKNIPAFFKSYWPEAERSPAPLSHIHVYLLESTQLLDFVFVENFKNNFIEEYMEICRESNCALKEKFSSVSLRMNLLENV